jgi:dodecin
MPDSVYKVIELIGTSKDSWEKAAAVAVNRAGKSLRDLRVAEVVQLDLQLDAKGKIEAYRAKLKVSFKFEGSETFAVLLPRPRLRGEVGFYAKSVGWAKALFTPCPPLLSRKTSVGTLRFAHLQSRRPQFVFTSGQPPLSSGRNASSPGTVAISL